MQQDTCSIELRSAWDVGCDDLIPVENGPQQYWSSSRAKVRNPSESGCGLRQVDDAVQRKGGEGVVGNEQLTDGLLECVLPLIAVDALIAVYCSSVGPGSRRSKLIAQSLAWVCES